MSETASAAPMTNSPSWPLLHFPHLEKVELPLLQRIRLHHPEAKPVESIEAAVNDGLGKCQRLRALAVGSEVAVAVGSRGISGIVAVVRATVTHLRSRGFKPFIVPAMGSHGGATADGQRALLASLGVTPENTDADVRATMDTVVYGRTPDGIDCHFDANAAGAAGIVVINRVKSHTSFDRPNESGLVKMLAVGLGKEQGARNVHRLGAPGLSKVLPDLARIALERAPIVAGIALVEDAGKQLVAVEGVEPEAFFETDARLLEFAKSLLGRLPFETIDALVVEMIGKEISGAGMDHAVTGRADIRGIPNPVQPFVSKIAVLGVSPKSHGNGLGIGLADFTTVDVVKGLDLRAIYMNSITSTLCEKARIPIALPTEKEAVSAAVITSWAAEGRKARMCVIRSTLHLDEILVSPALLEAHGEDDRLEPVGAPAAIQFTPEGVMATRCA
jgi:hypothetical protein